MTTCLQSQIEDDRYLDIAANLQSAHELGMAVIHHVDPGTTVRELEYLLGLSDRRVRRRWQADLDAR